jgi:diaminohydroxyphosphoribosylaminopyrimidine deaminase/5-amino-6-(5-phosphoribosylamino)uracil reductase
VLEPLIGIISLMSFSDLDRTLMDQALALARQALWLTSPNPRVGCVIARADGTVLGAGHTQRAGEAHAEVMALRDALSRGHDVSGATAYVTLEPCSHQGRTGPCCDALVQARLARVVMSLQDPNPLVSGQGLARLRAAGIQVDVGLGEDTSRDLNPGFIKRMTTGLPWVRMKIAASLDGQTALVNGVSQWITSEPARQDGHAWRARACSVLTGIGTVLEDNPKLDVRLVETPRQPTLVVVDSRLETSPQAALFEPERGVWIYHAGGSEAAAQALVHSGAQLTAQPNPHGKVDLQALMQDLGRREINEVHVEAGHKLNASLLKAGLVDELLVYLAPLLIGQGRGMTALGPLTSLGDALPLKWLDITPIGPDLRLRASLR